MTWLEPGKSMNCGQESESCERMVAMWMDYGLLDFFSKKRLEKRIPDDNTIKNFHRVLKALQVFRTLWKIQNQNSLAKGVGKKHS